MYPAWCGLYDVLCEILKYINIIELVLNNYNPPHVEKVDEIYYGQCFDKISSGIVYSATPASNSSSPMNE